MFHSSFDLSSLIGFSLKSSLVVFILSSFGFPKNISETAAMQCCSFTCQTLRDQINGKREDDGGVLLGADGVQSLTFQFINIDGKYFSFKIF